MNAMRDMTNARGPIVSNHSLKDFDDLEEIGRGGFGVVKRAKWKKHKDMTVALKELDASMGRRMAVEVTNHSKLDYVNIVKYYGSFTENRRMYIIMEYCKLGSLRHFVRENGPLSLDHAKEVLLQLSSAVSFLHERGIVHRDLSAGNVLIARIRPSGAPLVKICDFGLSKEMGNQAAAHTCAGTPGYMAPQVLNQQNYGPAADVYSLGCLFYFMLTAQEPKGGRAVKMPHLDELCEEAESLIRRLTMENESKRLTVAELSSLLTREQHRARSRERRSSLINERNLLLRSASREEAPRAVSTSRRAPSSTRAAGQGSTHRSPSRDEDRRRFRPRHDWRRLAGKPQKAKEGRVVLVRSEREAEIRDREDRFLLGIQLDDRGGEKIGVPRCGRQSHSSPCYACYRTPGTRHERELYNELLDGVESIRATMPKVVLNGAAAYPDGIAKLMENGDLKVSETTTGKRFVLDAGEDRLIEGDAKLRKYVDDDKKLATLMNLRKFCNGFADLVESCGFTFPHVIGGDPLVPPQPIRPLPSSSGSCAGGSLRGTAGPVSRPRCNSAIPATRTKSATSGGVAASAWSEGVTKPLPIKPSAASRFVMVHRNQLLYVKDKETNIQLRRSTANQREFVIEQVGHPDKRIEVDDWNYDRIKRQDPDLYNMIVLIGKAHKQAAAKKNKS